MLTPVPRHTRIRVRDSLAPGRLYRTRERNGAIWGNGSCVTDEDRSCQVLRYQEVGEIVAAQV
jgi:hypothetical protein